MSLLLYLHLWTQLSWSIVMCKLLEVLKYWTSSVSSLLCHNVGMTSFSTWQFPFLAVREKVLWWPQLHVAAACLAGVQLAGRDWTQLALLGTLWVGGWVCGTDAWDTRAKPAAFSRARGQECPSALSACVRLLVHICPSLTILMRTFATEQKQYKDEEAPLQEETMWWSLLI